VKLLVTVSLSLEERWGVVSSSGNLEELPLQIGESSEVDVTRGKKKGQRNIPQQ